MTEIAIPAHHAALFHDTLAARLAEAGRSDDETGIIGFSDTMSDASGVLNWDRATQVWRQIAGSDGQPRITCRDFSEIDLEKTPDAFAPCHMLYLDALDDRAFAHCVGLHCQEMIPCLDDATARRIVLCLSYGALILSPDFPDDLARHPAMRGAEAPYPGLVGNHARLLVDSHYASAHDTLGVLRRAERLLAALAAGAHPDTGDPALAAPIPALSPTLRLVPDKPAA